MLGLGAAAAAAPEAKTTESEIKEGLALLRARLKEKRKLEDDCFKAHEKKAKAELALRLANSRFDSVQALLQPVRNEDFAMDNLLALGRAVLRGGDEDEAMEPEVLPIPGLNNPVPPVPAAAAPAPAHPAPPIAAPAAPFAPAPAPPAPPAPAPAPPAVAPPAPPADNNDFTITAQDVGAFPTVDVDDSAYDATLHMRCAAVFAHDLPVECNICRGDFKAGDHFVGCANNLCAGRFHINCAARWLDQSVGHYRVVDDSELHGVACCACPVCGLRPFAPDWSDPPDRDRDD